MLSRFMSYVLALMVPCAMAQTPEQDRQREYYRQLDQQREEQQRRAQEEYQRQLRSTEDARKKTQEQYDDERRSANARPASSSYDARGAAELQALRAKLLRMPPLPDERNTLLGRWRVEGDGKPKRKDELGQAMAMLSNPGGAACQFTFGDGITEFKSKTWASIDAHGDDSLGPIAYRADGKRLFALPAKGVEIMGFDVVSPNRIEVFNLPGCALVRVTGTTTTTQSGPPNRAPLASGAGAPPAAGAPKSSTAAANSSAPSAAALPQMASAAPSVVGAVVDGAAFQCADGSLLHVSLCQGASADSTCKLTELHKPPHGLQMGTSTRRADIAARVKGCEAGGIRYGADHKAIFVR